MSYVGILCLDPGHQDAPNSDTGCSGFGLHEEDIVLDICKRAKPLIEAKGIKVIMTRDGATVNGDGSSLVASLNTRCQIANYANADLFLSVHCDAFNSQAYGTTTHIYGTGGNAERFAKILSPQMGQLFYNRGIKVSNFQVLRETNMPATLLETAFLDNQQDNEKLADPNVRQQIAVIIAKSVCTYFGVEFKEEQPQPTPIQTQEVNKKVSERTGSDRITPTGSNITSIAGGGWIESLPDRLIIHYNEYRYITIGTDGCWVYTPEDSKKII